MKAFLSIVLLLLGNYAFTQETPPGIEWQKSLGGSGSDAANSINQTTDGGYIVAGYSGSTNGDVTGNHGGNDYWVIKLDATGTIQWQRSLGGSAFDGANSIQQTTDGGYIVAGGSTSNNGDVTGNHGSFDYWVVKLDGTGNIQWQRSLGGSGYDYATSIQQTTDGGYIVAGWSGSNNGDVSGNHGTADYWVVKLDATGNIQWQRSLGGGSTDVANFIQQTTDGGYIVAGYSGSNDGDVSGNHGGFDYWVVKLDAAGSIQWQKPLGGSGYDEAYSIQQTTDGGYIIAGYSSSKDGDVTGNHGDSNPFTRSYDYWVVKLDAAGNIQWQRSLGGTSVDHANSIQQTTGGGYIVVGDSESKDGDVTGNHGNNDYWLVKLDAAGNIQWQRSIGGSDDDVANSIQQTTDGGYIVAGYSGSNNGDVSGNHGDIDYWVVKLSPPCTIPAMPGVISSNIAPCVGRSVMYSVAPVAGAKSYTWETPPGWSIKAGEGTNSIIVTAGNTSGKITVFAKNECGNSPGQGITVSPGAVLTPSVRISSTATTICTGSNVTFTASATNGGASPLYQWKKNGSDVGSNSTTYSDAALKNGDVITCTLLSSESCAIPASVLSNRITIGVSPSVTPAISIIATATTICPGSNVTFTATATNGGASPVYQWKKNGNDVGSNNATYTDAALNDGDVITCELISSESCAATATVSSNSIPIKVTASVTPAISITATATTICTGSNVTFTATATNGGASPVYQWKKNGNDVGSNNATYTDAALNDGDVITCTLTSSETCAATATVSSNSIPIKVSSSVTPAISIIATATTICAGSNVTFTASATNGGASPVYQWKKNGSNVGSNSTTYSDAALNDGDVITCTLTSSESCAATATILSNSIPIKVSSSVMPAISIVATATTICAGSNVTFTASAINGGASPVYQWKKNGSDVGSNNATYTDAALNDGDVITCELTSNESCAATATVVSNHITVKVSSSVTPTVNITSTATIICAGDEVTFTASVPNILSSPVYQWQLNGKNVGINSAVYATRGLSDKDKVLCIVAPGGSNNNCIINTASSNIITITINPLPAISIMPADTTVISGSRVQFNTSVSGSIRSFKWLPASGLVNSLSLSPLTVPVTAGTQYLLTIISEDGCAVSREATIRVFNKFYMPNAFTPNNDGLNDLFRIPPNVAFTLKDFSVYDSWGRRIFFTTDINSGWDGRVNGVMQQTGIYIYTIHGADDKGPVFLKGVFTLLH